MRLPVLFRALLIAQLLFLEFLVIPRLSHAAEWSMEPSVRVASEYNDNIRMTTQPHNSVHGLTTAPRLDLGVRSDIWQINGSAEYERKNYSGEEGLDTNNKYLSLGSSYRAERSVWQLNGSLTRASTLASERVSTDEYVRGAFYYFPVVDVVQTHRIREVTNISPLWSWSMDERRRLLLSYQYTDVSYVDGRSVGLSDSSSRGATIRFTNQVNPVDQVFLSGSYSFYQVPEVARATAIDINTYVADAVNPMLLSSESRSATYQAGIAHAFSESMRGNLSYGARRTEAEQLYRTCPSPNSAYLPPGGTPLLYPAFGEPCLVPYEYRTAFSMQSSAVFSADLEVQHENTTVTVVASRDFSLGSMGDQARSDTLSLAAKRSFTDKMSGNISGSISEYSSETGAVIGTNYRTYQIQPSLRWQWTQELSVDMNYRRTGTKYAWESRTIVSNYVYVGLRYQWSGLSFSR